MRRSIKGELMFSEKEESFFEYEIENSDVEGIKLCDDITLNKMRDNDIMAKKIKINANEIYIIEEESNVTAGLGTPNL
jgi:hypothetical protein